MCVVCVWGVCGVDVSVGVCVVCLWCVCGDAAAGVQVKSHPYVRESEPAKPIVIETLKFLYDLDMDDKKEVDMNNPIARPRVPYEVLFVIGGWSGGSPTNMVETYDTRADRWVVCENPDSGQLSLNFFFLPIFSSHFLFFLCLFFFPLSYSFFISFFLGVIS